MSYKRFKSAAHNFARSYASSLNWVADDYVMSYLARAALRTGRPELEVDLLSGIAKPTELVSPPVAASNAARIERFSDHLRAEGTDPERVREATLVIRFDLEKRREPSVRGDLGETFLLPFTATVRILDDRGVEYRGTFRDEWAAEVAEPASRGDS